MAGFVPLPRQSLPWEPLLRRPPEAKVVPLKATLERQQERPLRTETSKSEPEAAKKPVEPLKAGPDVRTLTASIRAEFEAKETARAKEHAAGMARLQQLQSEEQAKIEQLQQLATELETTRQKLLSQLRYGSGQIILEAARKIAGDGLRAQPELLDRMVHEAVDALGKKGLVLYVSAEDGDRIRGALAPSGIEVEIDFSIEGGVRAEGSSGRLDATLSTAMNALTEVISQWQQTQG